MAQSAADAYAMSPNVVFINIDWAGERHQRLKANMIRVHNTIANVVREMDPAMICMCEVGVAKFPLTEEQMKEVADQSIMA